MNTNSIAMWVTLPNSADWDCFQDSDFAGDLEDSKSTSGGTMCVFGSHAFRSNKLNVQETNFSFAQLNRIRHHFCGCRIEVRWYSRT